MGYWLDAQDHTGSPRGWAPFCERPNDYRVYINAVTDCQVRNDGSGDQAGIPGSEGPLQRAINNEYLSGGPGNRFKKVTTYEPRVVFLPSGVYQISHKLDMRLNTVLVGDPNDPPVIQASPDFQGNFLIDALDTGSADPTTCFMMLIKNVIVDTTRIASNRSVTAIHWAIAQACGLTNITIKMPSGQSGTIGHTGILMDRGSTITVTDVNIVGGLVGIDFRSQQAAFKSINFTFCTTAFAANGGFTALIQNSTFEKVGFCADITNGSLGNLVLLDCNADNSGPAVKLRQPVPGVTSRNNQVAIQNLTWTNSINPLVIDESPNAFQNPLLPTTAHVDTWLFGNVQPGVFRTVTTSTTPSKALLGSNGKFLTKNQPKYDSVTADQIVNVKAVADHPVQGNGSTDDVASLNAILHANAGAGKLTYFPYGVYLVKSTLVIPSGTRIVGEGWPVISGSGAFFNDADNPQAVVQIGQPNEVGACEISEMRFSVAEILPGAKIVEVNLSGSSAGDVGIWNSLVTVGGTRDSQVRPNVSAQDTSNSKAAFCTVHLTSQSSAYVENLWSWTADHDLDGGLDGQFFEQIISTGRGLLCEATKGTWLVGTGFEHHWLYQYNFNNASNVFAGLLQTETPYMQGQGAVLTVPSPWSIDSRFGDPDYSWTQGPNDQAGRTALAVNVSGGSDLYFYNGAHWAFFTGPWNSHKFIEPDQHVLPYSQTNMIRVAGTPRRMIWYGIATKQADTMILDGQVNARQFNNPGGWMENNQGGGLICAYRVFA